MNLTQDNLEEIITECLNRYDHPKEYELEDSSVYISDPHERHHEIHEKLSFIEGKIEKLDEKLDSLELNMSPLLDLLNTLIKTNISTHTLEEVPKEIDNKPELAYRVDGDNIYIYGRKTYDNKDLIKSTFRNAAWSKDNSAWTFNVTLNIDYEDKLTEFFPNIVKGQ